MRSINTVVDVKICVV